MNKLHNGTNHYMDSIIGIRKNKRKPHSQFLLRLSIRRNAVAGVFIFSTFASDKVLDKSSFF